MLLGIRQFGTNGDWDLYSGNFVQVMADLQKYEDDFLGELIDEAILGTCFEVHRASHLGTLFLDDVDPAEEEKYKLCDQVGYDIFGISKSGSKKTIECECPNCKRTLAASRFAPHLEKCMGMGRNSSRIASQRIANSGKLAAGECNEDEADYDADWVVGNEGGSSRKSSKKRKADKMSNSPRVRGPLSKSKLQTSSPRSNGSGNSTRTGHTDHNENIHIDVVAGDYAVTSSLSDSTPKIRNKSPFDPSLGTWEPHITDSKSSDVSRKKSKPSKHSNSKKPKKRQNVSQSYAYS